MFKGGRLGKELVCEGASQMGGDWGMNFSDRVSRFSERTGRGVLPQKGGSSNFQEAVDEEEGGW